MKKCTLYEHFMKAFMNTFSETMNTMNTLRVKYYLFVKKKRVVRGYILLCRCVSMSQSLHSVHYSKQSVHKSLHKAFIVSSFFGGF